MEVWSAYKDIPLRARIDSAVLGIYRKKNGAGISVMYGQDLRKRRKRLFGVVLRIIARDQNNMLALARTIRAS